MSAKALSFPNYNTAAVLQRTYRLPLNKLDATTAPGVGDDDVAGYVAGSMWVDRTNDKVYVCTDNTTGAAVWVQYAGAGVGGGMGISAGTQSVSTGTMVFTNSNNITFGMSGSSRISASYAFNASAGTTSNNLNALTFANGSGVSFGLNAGTVTATVKTDYQTSGAYLTTARASTDAIGLNTAQTNVTWTANSSGLSINAAGYAGTGFTSTTTAGTAIVGTHNTAGLSLGVPAYITAGPATISEFSPLPSTAMIYTATLGQNSLYFQPFDLQAPLYAYRLNNFVSISTSISNAASTGSNGYTMSAALYTRMTGASTDRMSRLWSGSWYISFSQSTANINDRTYMIDGPIGIANSTSASQVSTVWSTTGAFNSASSYLSNSIGGWRAVPIPISLTLDPGRYWLAMANSSGTRNANISVTVNVMQQNNSGTGISGNMPYFRPFGTSSASIDASYYAAAGAIGTYSATSGAFPASVALTTDAIRGSSVVAWPLFNFSGYNAGTNAL